MSEAWRSSSTFLLLQPLFSLPWPIPAPRRQSKGAEESCWEQTRPQAFTAEWQFWTAGLAQGIQCAHEDSTGSPQQNYSPDCSRAAIYSLQSILITLRATLTCRSQRAATLAAQLQSWPQLTLFCALFYFSSTQILNSGSSSQGQPDVPWHRGHQQLQPVWSKAPPPTQQGAALSLLQHMVQMQRARKCQVCLQSPSSHLKSADLLLFPSHHFLFQINWLQHKLGSCLL